MTLTPELRSQAVNTIRMLSADAVQAANSGHPGAPMGQADVAFVLWHEFLRFDPNDPAWPARDRFVLSCGHASMLLYSMLHLWGFDLPMSEIKNFRQWDSKTPGHPEVGHTPGVEVTTGPLGQGVANSVGMALAARMLGGRIGDEETSFDVMGQRVFALCSDGDLMEGISSEAASMAGHWKLDNLIWLWDDNKITIDGSTDLTFTEDVGARFEGMGWRVLHTDGHDHDAIRVALAHATTPDGRPTLIVCRTHIGFGSPNKVDTSGAHGSPLGDDELSLTKKALGWPESPRFLIPDAVSTFFTGAIAEKKAARAAWDAGFAEWRERRPDRAQMYDWLWSDEVPAGLWKTLVDAAPNTGATRKISNAVINAALMAVPSMVGGSADLAGSNGMNLSQGVVGHPERTGDATFAGRKIHFGIREHAMGAVTNGMLLHGGLRPFSGTFLVFSDYMRPAIRLAALSKLRNIFVYTHDSIFLGEDGPTHQPVEHHWALRTIPGLDYFRPADGVEVAMTWAWGLQKAQGPVAMSLTRQGVPAIERLEGFDPRDVWKGGYVVSDAVNPQVILIGTGSELGLCVAAAEQLNKHGVTTRVVSMPCVERFEAQSEAYREAILPIKHRRIVTIEAGITGPWKAFAGRRGLTIGLDRFGASAPASDLAEQFGLTPVAVVKRIRSWLES